MSTASESAGAPNQLQTALKQGLDNLSCNQSITFTQYTKNVLAEDGYVFWVASTTTMTAKGSLHYASERDQDEDQTIGVNTVIFTSEVEVTPFNAVDMALNSGNLNQGTLTGTLWIASWDTPDGTIQIAFSSRADYYQQAGLFHYAGIAVYPALKSQLVASVADLPIGPIVSNSLPIWLGLPTAMTGLPGLQVPQIPMYASFLVPENIEPPYIVAHIEPGLTTALQGFPHTRWSERTGTGPYQLPSDQLCKDVVRLTAYGLTNQQALQWLTSLFKYSEWTDAFGFMNSPAWQDEKRDQEEIAAIAMKKTLVIDASYYQSTADAIARQLILSASCAFTVN